MHIVNVGYDSTNYYVLADPEPRLLVDVGFPGTLPKLQHACKRAGIDLGAIPYLLATHYHPDHAGLAQELQPLGIRLIVLDTQREAVGQLGTHMKPAYHYQPIDLAAAVPLTCAASRAFLARLGIAGEIIPTPGHSDDSVSLVLDDGAAFTGDLTPDWAAAEDPGGAVHQSWERLRAHGARTIYPGHGPQHLLH